MEIEIFRRSGIISSSNWQTNNNMTVVDTWSTNLVEKPICLLLKYVSIPVQYWYRWICSIDWRNPMAAYALFPLLKLFVFGASHRLADSTILKSSMRLDLQVDSLPPHYTYYKSIKSPIFSLKIFNTLYCWI